MGCLKMGSRNRAFGRWRLTRRAVLVRARDRNGWLNGEGWRPTETTLSKTATRVFDISSEDDREAQ